MVAFLLHSRSIIVCMHVVKPLCSLFVLFASENQYKGFFTQHHSSFFFLNDSNYAILSAVTCNRIIGLVGLKSNYPFHVNT